MESSRLGLCAARDEGMLVVYTLLAKLPGGELGPDWTHTTLYLASGVVAVCAGCLSTSAAAAKAFTVGLLLVYGPLGAAWFVGGRLVSSTFRIPLKAAHNGFHLSP